MALWTVREHVIEMSGRSDLGTVTGVVGTSTDNGMNTFINMGQRYLDTRLNWRKAQARFQKDIASGDNTLTFENCRAIKRVWALGGDDDSRTELEKVDRDRLLAFYDLPPADLDTDRPKYYAPNITMLSPEQQSLIAATYDNDFTREQDDLINIGDTAAAYEIDGIIFFPPADEAYTLVVEGLFYSPPLSANTDKSYWTERHPEMLEFATLFVLETFYRNTEGAKDWMNSLNEYVDGLVRDAVEEEITNVTEMKG